MRIKFKSGEQREFLELIMEQINAPSIRGILQFGLKVPYSTLKNYYNESRAMPKDLFEDLCEIALIGKSKFEVEEVSENWGRIKGGKIGKRR